ncbi:MAG: serine hydrolase domain-containing protein [Candidatus Thorarchaeota archaeon]|jgi:CubicO group peptidase (beta-lactamase class C family)
MTGVLVEDDEKYSKLVKRLRTKMHNWVEKGPATGAAFSIVTTNGPLFSEGYGFRDVANSAEVDEETIFQIGSTAKIFTGLAFMLAVQDGLVTLDDRLVDHWPEFTIHSRHGQDEYREITYRHLLSHRSGLPRDPRIGGIFGCHDKYVFEEMVESLKDCWMVAPVNDRYYYSNVGMDAVAYALQRITRMNYPKWVQKKLGVPLALSTLRLGSAEALREENVAIGSEDGIHEISFAASEDYGCGDIWIGNADLAKVLNLVLNEGSYQGEEVLQKKLFRETTKPHFVKEKGHQYGLGVDIMSGFTPTILSHGGGSLGYGSTFYWIPKYGFGVSVQTNWESLGGKKNPHHLGRDAREALLKVHGVSLIRPHPDDFLAEGVATSEFSDPSHLAGFYAGLWNNSVIVSFREESLHWHDRFEMTQKGIGFVLPSGNAIRFNFKSKKSKRPYGLTYVNLRWPAAMLNLYRVKPVGPTSNVSPLDEDKADQLTGIYKARYYGSEFTFNLALVKDGELFIQTLTGLRPAYPHKSREGLFFLGYGEAVVFESNELSVENVRGVKWADPVSELRKLAKTNPSHGLLVKWRLDQVASHLKTLKRRSEANEVREIKKQLYPSKKKG